jgi:hypothetical protein
MHAVYEWSALLIYLPSLCLLLLLLIPLVLRSGLEAIPVEHGVPSGTGGAEHGVSARASLRESDDVPNRLGSSEDSDEAVEPERHARMWRCAAPECAEEVPETADLVVVELQDFAHHVLLQLGVVDTYTATTDLLPVQDEVIVLPADVIDFPALEQC